MGGLKRASSAAAAAVVGGIAARATWWEPRGLELRRRTLHLPRWPEALDGLRVAVASDFHAGGPHVDAARVARIAALLAREDADLVLLLGDFVDHQVLGGGEEPPERVGAALGALRPRLGTWAVLGNHDWEYDGERVRDALAAEGIRVLEDQAAEAGEGLWIAGTADPEAPVSDPPLAWATVPPDAALLVLLHHPDQFPQVPEQAALALAGHTHGGQVDLPGRARWIPSYFGARYARGLTEEEGRLLLVTSGIGQSTWPVRLRRPPEALLLTLRARPSTEARRSGTARPSSA